MAAANYAAQNLMPVQQGFFTSDLIVGNLDQRLAACAAAIGVRFISISLAALRFGSSVAAQGLPSGLACAYRTLSLIATPG